MHRSLATLTRPLGLTSVWGGVLAVAAALALGTIAARAEPTGAAGAGEPPAAASTPTPKATSGLPIPRFVSLKSDRVNLRTGPGTQYPTSWVFRRAGLPLEVVAEFDNWRQVRDSEGTSGWVLQSLLSGRRTAVVTPWDAKEGKSADGIPIRSDDSDSATPVATAEPGVIASLHACDGKWCDVSVGDYRGYLPQKLLWGIYENEILR